MLRSCLRHLNQLRNVSQRESVVWVLGVKLRRVVLMREGWGVGNGVFDDLDFTVPSGIRRLETLRVKRHLRGKHRSCWSLRRRLTLLLLLL